MQTRHYRKSITFLLIGTLIGIQAAAYAGEAGTATGWVMLGESPLLDRSSKYLYKGNDVRGVRYAEKTLARRQAPLIQALAHHNLCIGYTRLGEAEAALSHFEAARTAVLPRVALKQIKPGLYRASKKRSAAADGINLAGLVARNLDINAPGDGGRIARID